MLIPIRTDSPLRRTPWVNYALIAANVAVFLVITPRVGTVANGGGGGLGLFDQYGGQWVKQLLSLDPQAPNLWSYFTYQFVHEGWSHLLGNMLFLYIFGNNINDRMGHLGYACFCLAGGVFAGIGHVLIEHQVPVIGASGAVAAVTGAYLILLPRSNITVFYFFILVGAAEIASLWFILFFLATEVASEFRPEWFGGTEGVAHVAHIAGLLYGAGVCLALLAAGLLPRDPLDVLAMIQRWNRRRQYREMVSKGYNPFGYSPPPPRPDVRPAPPSPAAQRALELRAEIGEAIARHQVARAAMLYLDLRKLDPTQVLSRQAQLDVSNQLASQQYYPQAAEAYEAFLRTYPNFEQIEQVELMLGVVYARYLDRYDRAKQLLTKALARLHSDREIQWARSELARIEPMVAAGTRPTR